MNRLFESERRRCVRVDEFAHDMQTFHPAINGAFIPSLHLDVLWGVGGTTIVSVPRHGGNFVEEAQTNSVETAHSMLGEP